MGLAAAVALASAACTSGSSPSGSPRPSTGSPVAASPVLTELHQQTALRFVHLHNAANPNAVVVLTSSRNLRPGQRGPVLKVRAIGNLMGSCGRGQPTATFHLTYRGPGPPVVTELRKALPKPIGLHLAGPYWPPVPSPAHGKQRFAFFQIVAGGEAADFSLALWATLTPVAGGCAFSANGVLRVRCSAFADPICSYIARRSAWAHQG